MLSKFGVCFGNNVRGLHLLFGDMEDEAIRFDEVYAEVEVLGLWQFHRLLYVSHTLLVLIKPADWVTRPSRYMMCFDVRVRCLLLTLDSTYKYFDFEVILVDRATMPSAMTQGSIGYATLFTSTESFKV
ncbi:hypothetical protein RHGRI_027760 [Rhododendron griersonianum]|uniref:Uncharacterized protein n=1 Tax=Rhododendron griersonianum TaxID=479676 RepID=A0AAV6IXV6_9ERIC|nr:hypothetical protein RHGRI_027760 [Rhododendron griersonianum]